jgi:hypothetical protein
LRRLRTIGKAELRVEAERSYRGHCGVFKASANAGAKNGATTTAAASAATGAAKTDLQQKPDQCLHGGQKLRREVIATSELGINAVGAGNFASGREGTHRRDCKELKNEKRNVKSTY